MAKFLNFPEYIVFTSKHDAMAAHLAANLAPYNVWAILENGVPVLTGYVDTSGNLVPHPLSGTTVAAATIADSTLWTQTVGTGGVWYGSSPIMETVLSTSDIVFPTTGGDLILTTDVTGASPVTLSFGVEANIAALVATLNTAADGEGLPNDLFSNSGNKLQIDLYSSYSGASSNIGTSQSFDVTTADAELFLTETTYTGRSGGVILRADATNPIVELELAGGGISKGTYPTNSIQTMALSESTATDSYGVVGWKDKVTDDGDVRGYGYAWNGTQWRGCVYLRDQTGAAQVISLNSHNLTTEIGGSESLYYYGQEEMFDSRKYSRLTVYDTDATTALSHGGLAGLGTAYGLATVDNVLCVRAAAPTGVLVHQVTMLELVTTAWMSSP